MNYDKLEAETECIRARIEAKCAESYKLLEDLSGCCEPSESIDITHNMDELAKIIGQLATIRAAVEELENRIPFIPEDT